MTTVKTSQGMAAPHFCATPTLHTTQVANELARSWKKPHRRSRQKHRKTTEGTSEYRWAMDERVEGGKYG